MRTVFWPRIEFSTLSLGRTPILYPHGAQVLNCHVGATNTVNWSARLSSESFNIPLSVGLSPIFVPTKVVGDEVFARIVRKYVSVSLYCEPSKALLTFRKMGTQL